MSRDTASTNNPILQGYIDSDERVDRQRRLNRMKQFRYEVEQEEQMQKAEEENARRTRAIQREAALAEAVGQQKLQQIRDEKERQLIRDDPELRELRRALQMAEINQGRATQIVEGKQKVVNMKQIEQVEDQKIEEVRQAAVAAREEADRKRKEQLRTQKSVLERQMQEREEAKLEAYKQFLKEKQLVDEIVRRIHEEDERDQVERMRRQRQTQQYIQDYLDERNNERRKERERQEEEDRKIVEYMMNQAKRKEDEKGKAMAKLEQQRRILEEQSRVISEQQRLKDETDDILNEYYQEQREEQARKREQNEMEKRIRDRIAMIEANEHQKKLKAAKVAMEKKEEEEFRKMMMEKFAEDDRIEQMNTIKRNQRRAEHHREVQKLVEQKRAMRDAELEREIALTNLEKEREARRHQIIEEERQKLLREHAVRLQAYLPKGVLRAEDFEALGIDPAIAGSLTSMPKF